MRDLSVQAEGQAEGPEALALLACGVTLGSGFRNPTDYLSERAWVQIKNRSAVSSKMRSAKARDFVRALDSQKRAGEDMHAQLQTVAKGSREWPGPHAGPRLAGVQAGHGR